MSQETKFKLQVKIRSEISYSMNVNDNKTEARIGKPYKNSSTTQHESVFENDKKTVN